MYLFTLRYRRLFARTTNFLVFSMAPIGINIRIGHRAWPILRTWLWRARLRFFFERQAQGLWLELLKFNEISVFFENRNFTSPMHPDTPIECSKFFQKMTFAPSKAQSSCAVCTYTVTVTIGKTVPHVFTHQCLVLAGLTWTNRRRWPILHISI